MKKASILMIVGSLMLMGLFVFPLWNVQLGAPQYPEPLGMDIYINGIKGQSEFDIQNIDGLNHYIGMKTLPKAEDMWEFTYFPIVVLVMALLGTLIGVLAIFGKMGPMWFLGWFIVMSVLGVLGLYDFNLWMLDYGTNLDPHAILKMQNLDGTPMSYKPPLFGHKRLLNFDAYSYPHIGGYMTGLGLLLTFVAFVIGRKVKTSVKTLSILLLPLMMLSCTVKPEAISYGEDECHYCRMTVVDRIHAAEVVNDKGKVFKYDAIECMLNDSKEFEHGEISMFLVNHHDQPQELISAKEASYLISKNLPSPMGAFLTAFPDSESASKALQEHGGKLYNWNTLLAEFSSK